jgi:D-3-phosphoglycerate dehydrogenase
VIWLGDIGAEVARIARGIGMQVIAYNRTPRPDVSVPLVDIDTLLARADVVSMNLVLNDATRGFLSRERIARMKPLIEALASGHIRHAGLDVFETEPLKADHPLAALPNVTVTAHAAFRTLEASMTLLRRAIDIVKTLV